MINGLPILADQDPLDATLAHPLFHLVGSLHLSNQMLMVLIAAVLMLIIFPSLFSHASSEVPTGSRNLFESILEFLRLEVFRPALKEHTDRFVPFLWTQFFFILFCNLLGQIPIAEFVTFLTGHESAAGGTATCSIVTTGTLAVCSLVVIHVNGLVQVARELMNGTYGHHEEPSASGDWPHATPIDDAHLRGEALPADVTSDFRALGDPTAYYDNETRFRKLSGLPPSKPIHTADVRTAPPHMNPVLAILLSVPLYLWNFAPHVFKVEPTMSPGKALGVRTADLVMWFFLLIMELIGALIKPFALAIRLFANMIGGHAVLGGLIIMIPVASGWLAQVGVGIPVTLMGVMIRGMEVFVCFLQAYIFTFLTTLFIASAIAPDH